MSATAAIAASSAAIAASAAAEAHRSECRAAMSVYDAKTASLGQAREYADCVYFVYGSGEPMGYGVALLIKVAILVVFASMAVGAWLDNKDGLFGRFEGAFLGLCASTFAMAGAGLAGLGIWFVVS